MFSIVLLRPKETRSVPKDSTIVEQLTSINTKMVYIRELGTTVMVPDEPIGGAQKALGHVRTLCSVEISDLPGGLMSSVQGWTACRRTRGWK